MVFLLLVSRRKFVSAGGRMDRLRRSKVWQQIALSPAWAGGGATVLEVKQSRAVPTECTCFGGLNQSLPRSRGIHSVLLATVHSASISRETVSKEK
jgi:hypothetical protein